MTARAFLTGHTRQEKETARKRGPSLQEKTIQLGEKANIRIVTVYENPTHGVWHIAKHCPAGKTLPDIGKLVDEFTRTGKLPTVRDVSRPRARARASPPAAVSRTTRSSRRKTRTAAQAAGDIYDVPDNSDSETLCSASIIYRPQNNECDEWGPDESTVAASTMGDTSTVQAADATGEADVLREHDAMGEHYVIEEQHAVEQASTGPATDVAGQSSPVAEVEQMAGWGLEHTLGMGDAMEWQPEGMAIWEAENTTTMEDTLGWQSEIDMQLWNTYSPAVAQERQTKGTSPVVAQTADQQPAPVSTTCPGTKNGDVSKHWVASALMEAIALRRRFLYCLL